MSWSGPHRFSAAVFVGKDFLGEFTFPALRGEMPAPKEIGYYRVSYAYFCPTCGEVWARIVVIDHQGKQCPFNAAHVSCEEHTKGSHNIGGSLLVVNALDLLDHFPEPLVRREFRIYMQHVLKELE